MRFWLGLETNELCVGVRETKDVQLFDDDGISAWVGRIWPTTGGKIGRLNSKLFQSLHWGFHLEASMGTMVIVVVGPTRELMLKIVERDVRG